MEYRKIETMFERDEKFRVTDRLKMPVIETIKEWDVTEKIDGTNIRIMLSQDGKINFGGRTDNASIPSSLLQTLFSMFSVEKMKEVFWRDDVPVAAVLYGEGYGAGIQKSGGNYRKDKSFRLFDVLIDGKWWLDWDNTKDIAGKLGIKTVPYCGRWTLEQIIENVKEGVPSNCALEDSGNDKFISEGIVGRTIEPLFDKRGRRLIIKLKTRDYLNGNP